MTANERRLQELTSQETLSSDEMVEFLMLELGFNEKYAREVFEEFMKHYQELEITYH